VIDEPLPLRDGADWAALLARHRPRVLLSCWSTPPLPADLPVGGTDGLGAVCHFGGTARRLVPRSLLERGLRVTNWGDTINATVAECGLLMILGALRKVTQSALDLHVHRGWKASDHYLRSLFGRRVGLHGFGSISRHLVELLRPFGVTIATYSPRGQPLESEITLDIYDRST